MRQLFQVTNHDAPPQRNYTADDLAERWHCSKRTVLLKRRKLGLKMTRVGKTLTASESSVLEVEARLEAAE